jgi:hypothetical protein
MSVIEHYYYLHENGDLICKPNDDFVVSDLRDSDLVRAFWGLDLSNRASAWEFLVEAFALGAKKERVLELATKWGCDDEDGQIYADRIGVKLNRDGNAWCATKSDFINLAESPAGFGNTILETLSELCKALEFSPTKLNWHARFSDLVKV